MVTVVCPAVSGARSAMVLGIESTSAGVHGLPPAWVSRNVLTARLRVAPGPWLFTVTLHARAFAGPDLVVRLVVREVASTPKFAVTVVGPLMTRLAGLLLNGDTGPLQFRN